MSETPSLTPPPPETDPLVPGPAPSAFDRAKARKAAFQARAQQVADQAEDARAHHKTLDAAFEGFARDVEVGGGIIAGALAYKFFVWLLPFALVLVAALGITADAAGDTPTEAAKTLGIAGIVSQSIASAASGANRWYALIVGVPVLLYVTRSVLRALIGAHRLVWTDLAAAAPRPTPKATLRLLGLLLAFFAATALAGAARAWSTGPGVVITLLMMVPYTGFWLLVTMRLPHRDANWKGLLPGAITFGIGIVLIQVFTAYVIAPMSLTKQGTYGALGIAAALLFGLYLIARLMVGAAVINATLWDRHVRGRTAESDSIPA
jgi:uncharacterized BrkB/YihY/UPF0761 family membrane protein